ncbi:MAG TPA: cytochrome P460 family protein [Cyclobacteriaceae bacterium]|nr:cytochrome P460 family protein [Cyclobacteriaceae bacterium]
MNKRFYFITVTLCCVTIVLASFSSPSDKLAIPYPDGYRDWMHVKTYIVGPKNPAFKLIGGFNHVYANDVAMKGYTTGDFPDGSVIVSDVISTVEDSITIREGGRHHIDVMVKDDGAWDFESFRGDSKSDRMLTPDVVAKCVTCHRKDKNMVFSEYRH